MPNYTNILYWKWGYPTFEGTNLEDGLMDIIRRSDFETLYVSFHHVNYPFSDAKMLDAIKKCNRILNVHGRKLLLDIDVRNEGKEFEKAYPGQKGLYSRFIEFELDQDGNGSLDVPNLLGRRTGRQAVNDPPAYIINGWAFSLQDEKRYIPETLVNIRERTAIERIDAQNTRLSVRAGAQNAGKRVLIYPAIQSAIPDLFSPDLYTFYDTMFEHVKDIPLGGTATDEWGFDLMLQSGNERFYNRHFPFSPFMCKEYSKLTGRSMEEDMLYFLYAPADHEGMTMAAVSAYLEVLRAKMKENNDWFYAKSKEVFGPDTFVGVHPTYWGDATDFYLDVALNGLDWWEVKRDYAQTDELVLYPIRLALAHKWGGKVWYNMWYSMNTGKKETYFEETWVNARYGGRTHYLGYECPNEPGVLSLKGEGLLEEMNAMEAEIKKLNAFHNSQPDSRVLVLFGMEAVSCWNISDPGAREWRRNGGVLHKVLSFTKSLFESGYLCDLVPSSEIVNGSLRLSDGKAVYGTQTYDAVIFLLPEGIRKEAFTFLKEYYAVNQNLIVIGTCSQFSSGEKAADRFKGFTAGLKIHLDNIERIDESVAILKKWNIAGNIFENGCLFQDGSAIFTTNGLKNVGNRLKVDTAVHGHRVEFEGEDFLAIDLAEDGEIQRFAAGKCDSLKIDGKPAQRRG